MIPNTQQVSGVCSNIIRTGFGPFTWGVMDTATGEKGGKTLYMRARFLSLHVAGFNVQLNILRIPPC